MEWAKNLLRIVALLCVALVLVVGLVACADNGGDTTTEPPATDTGADNGTTDDPTVEEDPTVALIETKCSMCHTTDRVWSADMTREEWVATMDRMEANGLVVTDDEYNQIVDYLAAQ